MVSRAASIELLSSYEADGNGASLGAQLPKCCRLFFSSIPKQASLPIFNGPRATIKDALTALWEASDRVCGKRLKVMIPTLLPALEQHGRLQLGQSDRDRVLAISAANIDRLLVDVKIAASGCRRRRAVFYSAIRREVPIRTFNDWNSPVPGFCEVDMVAHGGTSVAGSFIQTLTMLDVANGWTECLPLLTREGSLVVEAINRAQSLFPWRCAAWTLTTTAPS